MWTFSLSLSDVLALFLTFRSFEMASFTSPPVFLSLLLPSLYHSQCFVTRPPRTDLSCSTTDSHKHSPHCCVYTPNVLCSVYWNRFGDFLIFGSTFLLQKTKLCILKSHLSANPLCVITTYYTYYHAAWTLLFASHRQRADVNFMPHIQELKIGNVFVTYLFYPPTADSQLLLVLFSSQALFLPLSEA